MRKNEKRPTLEHTIEWRKLSDHFMENRHVLMRDMFLSDPGRFEKFSLSSGEILVDFSKNRITEKTLNLLLELAMAAGVPEKRDAMFAGVKINWTEDRAVLHTALRNLTKHPVFCENKDVMPEIRTTLARIEAFSKGIRSGKIRGITGKPFRTIVHIGIGGSVLGPRFFCDALDHLADGSPEIRFLSNIDGGDFMRCTKDLQAGETLFIIASKTFTTLETMTNAESAKKWLFDQLKDEQAVRAHMVGLSANKTAMESFGIDPERMFFMEEWVGGRYSWPSVIGLPIAIRIGFSNFMGLLKGAHDMDMHFRTTPLEKNIPVILALIGIWNINFIGASTHAILPYAENLRYLPEYLQQCDMESNGKSVDEDGNFINYKTGPIIWGGVGTNGQHAFFQLIHQGTHTVPADFIGFVHPPHPLQEHHVPLMANFFAQTEALMKGKTAEEVRTELKNAHFSHSEIEKTLPSRLFRGNQPSTTILIDAPTPRSIGALVAMYEMKIFVQGIIWRINSFDQWGVELGKQLSKVILLESESLIEASPDHFSRLHDSSTAGLLHHFFKRE